MTRQKKELWNRINALQNTIAMECEGARGEFIPAGWFEAIYEEMEEAYDALAKLSHFPDMMAMLYDERGELATRR